MGSAVTAVCAVTLILVQSTEMRQTSRRCFSTECLVLVDVYNGFSPEQ